MDKPQPDRAEQIGRKLGRMVKAARPQAQRIAEDMKPKLQKAGEKTIAFARDHEPEIRQTAAMVVRSRMPLPLGFVTDAIAPKPTQPTPTQQRCSGCETINPVNANFCNNCGARLSS